MIDLSAAFDLVDSEILITKSRIYGLHEDFLLWVRSYLTDRHQAVWIDHTFSEFVSHSIGVPQGSNLGPLFSSLVEVEMDGVQIVRQCWAVSLILT